MSVCFFADELFAFAYTFMNEHSNPKKNKHEENTKKRRRKHERYTQFCIFFIQTEDKSPGENSPLIFSFVRRKIRKIACFFRVFFVFFSCFLRVCAVSGSNKFVHKSVVESEKFPRKSVMPHNSRS